jgi:hypothetical protein
MMIPLRMEDEKIEESTLERLTQVGPVIVTRNGAPLFVVQEATSEWLEAWAVEMDETGDMTIEDYASVHGLVLEVEAYRQEFPEDAPFTLPRADKAA